MCDKSDKENLWKAFKYGNKRKIKTFRHHQDVILKVENVKVRVRAYKNCFFNEGINVKIIVKLRRKSEKWKNQN